MAEPMRVQLSRRRGWRKPVGAVVVTRATKWGNPYRLNKDEDTPENRQKVLAEYRDDLVCGLLDVTVEDVRRELRGKVLVCFCPLNKACHADVLLEIANREQAP